MAMAATGVATFAGALAVAGGMAAGLGILGNDKDFMRLGTILSAAGSLAGGLEGLATNGASDASSAWDAAGSAEGSDAGLLARNSRSVTEAATQGADIGDIADAGQSLGMDAMTGIDAAGNVQAPLGGGMGNPAAVQTPQQIANTLTGGPPAATPAPTTSLLDQAASSMTQQDLRAMLERGHERAGSLMSHAVDKVGTLGDSVGGWVKANPLVSASAFQALGSIYGPDAEALDMKRSLMERARRNLNSPIRLGRLTPPTPGG